MLDEAKVLEIFGKTSNDLTLLKDKIQTNNIGKEKELFRGADIRVLPPGDPMINKQEHWVDNDLRIVTPFGEELSWLLIQLRDIFYDNELIDFSNKFEFFCTLGDAAIHYHKYIDGEGNPKDLLLSVYDEAEGLINHLLKSMLPKELD